MNEHVNTFVAGLVFIGLGVWIWIYTDTFPDLQEGYPGPALFPRIIATGLLLSGLGFTVRSLRHWAALRQMLHQLRSNRPGLFRFTLGVGLVALYPLLQNLLGFIPTITILSFAIALMLKARLVVAAGTALLSALLLYGLFTGLLGVPL